MSKIPSRIVTAIDSVLTWVERLQRLSWGRTMMAFIIAAVVVAWGWLIRLPVPIIIVLALCAVALTLIIIALIPIIASKIAPFPFCVSVPALATSTISFQAHVVILNRGSRKLAIAIRVCCKETRESPGQWYLNFEFEGLNEKLRPNEKTEGSVRILQHKPDMPRGHWFMEVIDQVSGRKTPLFELTGFYPPDCRLLQTKSPSFVKTPDEVLDVVMDWQAELNRPRQ